MPERPVADPAGFSQTGPKRWICTTIHPLRFVLMDGFFDRVIDCGIKPDDRIDLIALGDEPASHAILVVDWIGADEGARVRVSVLAEFKRQL